MSPTTNNSAPDDFKDDFCVIMELTREEKRELLQLWKERLSCGS